MYKCWLIFVLVTLLATGQITTSTGVEDAVTPVAIQPGTPDGVYRLSDFEHVNVYNGLVSSSFPLIEIGGRGEARHTIRVGITRPTFTVQVNHENHPVAGGSGSEVTFTSGANISWWHPYHDNLPYSAGMVVMKQTGDTVTDCNGSFQYGQTLLHIVFLSPDGTETPLYSPVAPIGMRSHFCSPTSTSTNRGRIFRATDGSGMVFRSAYNLGDITSPSTGDYNATIVSGTLYFPNGVRYEVVDSRVNKIIDRNGNEVAFTFNGTNRVSQIKDSLQRTTSIAYDQAIAFGGVSNTCDTITQTGYGGASRNVCVCHMKLKDRLRVAFSPTANIFPELDGSSSLNRYDLSVVSAILYNNVNPAQTVEANPSYQFFYNQFAEVSRIVVPSGGAMEYDYGPGLPQLTDYVFASGQVLKSQNGRTIPLVSNAEPSEGWRPFIYRRLLQRRTYRTGGSSANSSAIESQTDYSRLETAVAASSSFGIGTDVAITNNQYIAAIKSSPSIAGTTPVTTHHYFHSFAFGIGGVNPVNSGGPAASLKNNLSTQGSSDPFEGKEYLTKIGPDLQWVERVYGVNPNLEVGQLCQENTIWKLSGNTSKTSAKVFFYDRTSALTLVPIDRQFNNQTDVFEYDFGSAPAIATATNGQTYNLCPADLPSVGTAARWTHTDFKSSDSFDNYFLLDGTSNSYSPFLRALPTKQLVRNGNFDLLAQTTYNYDLFSPLDLYTIQGNSLSSSENRRGNLIRTTRSVNGDQTTVSTQQAYDNLGNVVTSTDARGYVVSLGYADSFNGAVPPSSTRGFLTSITYPKAQPTDPDPQVKRTMTYDYNSGRLYSVTDPNSLVTTLQYNDPLDRLTDATRAGQRIKFTYTDTPNAMKVRKQADQYAADYRYNSETFLDGFGRPVRETSGTGTTIQVEREYDGFGRLQKLNRPRYGTSYAGAIEYEYDALGRTLSTKNSSDSSTTSQNYNGVDATTTDPKTKKRRTELDGLGRLVKVVEDPGGSLNSETTYTYSVLDKLLTVTQGAQTRTFTYDSIGRLKSATNPESGTALYTYDPNSNLVSRVDARGWTVCFGQWTGTLCNSNGYDSWNRPLRKQYSAGGSPNVELCYDGRRYVSGACTGTLAANEIGRLTAHGSLLAGTAVSDSNFVHDSAGRITSSWQSTPGAPQRYDFSYAYHLDSKLARTTMPVSLRNVRNCYDDQGRLYWVSGSTALTDSTCSTSPTAAPAQYYSKYESYGPGGEEWNVRYGTTTPKLLQTCTDLSQSYTGLRVGASTNATSSDCGNQTGDLFSESWSYLAGQNNGSVDSTTSRQPASSGVNTLRTDYTYDALNRITKQYETPFLASGTANAWQLVFNYDRYGNRIVDQTQSFAYSEIAAKTLSQYNSANQLIKSTQGVSAQDVIYDSAGNMTYHPALGTFSYDAENHQTNASTSSGSAQYFYDGEGKRVKKVVNGTTTIFAYDAFGQLAYEYSNGSSNQSGTQYLVHDVLGSTRLVLDQSGSVVSRRDYFAFGDEIPGSASFGGRGDAALKFNQSFAANQLYTGKERDLETGLDYFVARYMSSAQGRFISADYSLAPQSVPFADLSDPQTLNLYSYVRNSPLSHTDPSGHCLRPNVSCTQYAVGAVKAAANLPADAADMFNGISGRLTGQTVFPVPRFEAANSDQSEGMQAASVMMLLGPLVEAGVTKVLEMGGAMIGDGATVTRYMGSGEAGVAMKTGEIPNTNAAGEFRPTHVTTDPPVGSASEAQTRYELPSSPTHRATVPANRVKDLQTTPDGRARTSGGGSQAATHNPVPVKKKEIKPLEE